MENCIRSPTSSQGHRWFTNNLRYASFVGPSTRSRGGAAIFGGGENSKQTSLLTQPSVRGDSSGIKPSFSQLKLLLLMLNRPKQGAFIVCHCIILNHVHVFVQWKDKQKQMLIIRNPTPRAVTRYLSNHSCSLILRGKSGWKQTTWLVNPHCGMSKLGICNPNHHFMFHLFTLSVIGGFCSIVVLCFVCNVFFGGAMEH